MKWRAFLGSGMWIAGLVTMTSPAAAFEMRLGIDLITADAETNVRPNAARLQPLAYSGRSSGGAVRQASPLVANLRDGLEAYRASWGSLPQTHVPQGPALRSGQRGTRVALLRERLGLSPGDLFDEGLSQAVRAYRRAHALGDAAIADTATIASLNRGPGYYEQLIQLNVERLKAVPAQAGRYILVDAAAARLWLYEDGKPRDSMKVVVGKKDSPTPMLATFIRWAELQPYWNVPSDLVQKSIAPRVISEGVGYLTASQYEVLSDWSDSATVVDPATVDWRAVAAGRAELRVRQLPGAKNAMGDIKFMMRNDFGIYLHDTPNKELFASEDRWQSNGCVRVEDAPRLAKWLSRDLSRGSSGQPGEIITIEKPVPVYITYLTAAVDGSGEVVFRADPYNRDAKALAELGVNGAEIQTAALR